MTAPLTSSRQISTKGVEHHQSSMIMVALANVCNPEQGVGITKRLSAQNLLELFDELDKPDSDQALVGIQLVVPPLLNGSPQWVAEAVLDFGRVTLRTASGPCLDTYAFRLVSEAVFSDSGRIEPSDILEWCSLYEVCTSDEVDDLQLLAHQNWLSTVISRLVNAVNPPEPADEATAQG
ncbi:hypothetical protein T3H00_01835 [Pseudomonas fluorescens]|uniref:hypothetical protein n=1 Tax=Pseudomonas fluorescens TaxID=294 RepID=UPI002ACA4BB3|nr:hypothetical protein [Pseudomonas fluorescens]MDZ5431407.1 hypothetical protein [Pseudomonas fluorescens]